MSDRRTLRVEIHPDAGQWRAELWVDEERECYAKVFAYSPIAALEGIYPYMETVAVEDAWGVPASE